jgi:hypothetical protein
VLFIRKSHHPKVALIPHLPSFWRSQNLSSCPVS